MKNGKYSIKGKTLLLGKFFDGNEEKELPNLSHHAGAGIYANPQSVAKLAKAIWTPDFLNAVQKYETPINETAIYGIGYIKSGNQINHDGGMDGTRSSVILDLKTGKAGAVVATLENRTPKLVQNIDEISPEEHYKQIREKRSE